MSFLIDLTRAVQKLHLFLPSEHTFNLCKIVGPIFVFLICK